MNEFKVDDRVIADGLGTFKIEDGVVRTIRSKAQYPYEVESENRPGRLEIYSADELVRREGGVA